MASSTKNTVVFFLKILIVSFKSLETAGPMTPRTSDERYGQRGIDPSLRSRVESEFRSLLAALDAAVAGPAPETLEQLRMATDRLMRATARVRLEVERLAASKSVGSGPGVTGRG
jgi:hypothetical protein